MLELQAVIRVDLAPRCRITPATAAAFGMTPKAMRRKIEEGKWLERLHYFRDPDGNVWVDVNGVMAWVASGR